LQSGGSKSPIYFVPGLGGTSIGFLPLSRALGADQPFFGFQFPGLQGEAEPISTVEGLAEFFVAQLLQEPPRSSYTLGGWSLGGVIAFAMACQLEKRGLLVDRLVLVDSYLQGHLDQFARVALRSGVSSDGIDRLFAVSEVRGLNAPVETEGSLVTQGGAPAGRSDVSRVIEAGQAALRNFRPTGIYTGPVLYLYATENASDHALRGKEAARLQARLKRKTIDVWKSYLKQMPESVIPVRATHYSIIEEPAVKQVARAVQSFVADAHSFSSDLVTSG
jgi:thioesterase domain-containing protein